MIHHGVQAGHGRKRNEESNRGEEMEGISSSKNKGDQGMAYWDLKCPR